MKDFTDKAYGITIAFIIPGLVFLFGLSISFTPISNWLWNSIKGKEATASTFMCVLFAALAIGEAISSLRWLIVDQILLRKICGRFRFLCIEYEKFNFKYLKDDSNEAFSSVIAYFYSYYQFNANTVIALVLSSIIYIFRDNIFVEDLVSVTAIWLIVVFTILVLFLGGRNCLENYYRHGNQLLNNKGS